MYYAILKSKFYSRHLIDIILSYIFFDEITYKKQNRIKMDNVIHSIYHRNILKELKN